MISHRRRQLTVIRRDGDRWAQREVRAGERLSLDGDLVVAVDELYSVVDSLP